jgi:hypothetical protein
LLLVLLSPKFFARRDDFSRLVALEGVR